MSARAFVLGACLVVGAAFALALIWSSRLAVLKLSWYGVGPEVHKFYTYQQWQIAVNERPHSFCWTSATHLQGQWLGDVCRVPGIPWWEYRTECDSLTLLICGDTTSEEQKYWGGRI